MNDQDAARTHAEIKRAQEAREVAENPLFREAVDGLKNQLREQWEQSPARDTEGRERIWLALNLLGKVESHLLTAMETGRMARMQLEQEQTRLSKIKEALSW